MFLADTSMPPNMESDNSGILSTAFIVWGRADYQQPVGT